MLGRTHQLIGLTAAAGLVVWGLPAHYSPATLGAIFLAAHFGSLLPDTDSAAADIWEQIPLGGVVGRVADKILTHRSLTHSFLGVVLVAVLVRTLLNLAPAYWGLETITVWTAFMIGYISHLVADMLTVQGIPLFWPTKTTYGFPPRPIEELRIITGGWFENLVLFPLLNIALVSVVWSGWPLIRLWLFQSG